MRNAAYRKFNTNQLFVSQNEIFETFEEQFVNIGVSLTEGKISPNFLSQNLLGLCDLYLILALKFLPYNG